MMKNGAVTVIAVIAGFILASAAMAQRNYDPKTVETLEGKVLSVEKVTHRGGGGYGIHLMMQTEKETIAVHLGPAWYIEKQTPRLQANDTITVRGSRTTVDGKAAIIAAEIKKGGDTLKLRDENGVPLWSGQRRGR